VNSDKGIYESVESTGRRVEVRQDRGTLVFWGILLKATTFPGGPCVYYVKPNGLNPSIGKAIRYVSLKEVRNLSLLELIAEASAEVEDEE